MILGGPRGCATMPAGSRDRRRWRRPLAHDHEPPRSCSPNSRTLPGQSYDHRLTIAACSWTVPVAADEAGLCARRERKILDQQRDIGGGARRKRRQSRSGHPPAKRLERRSSRETALPLPPATRSEFCFAGDHGARRFLLARFGSPRALTIPVLQHAAAVGLKLQRPSRPISSRRKDRFRRRPVG